MKKMISMRQYQTFRIRVGVLILVLACAVILSQSSKVVAATSKYGVINMQKIILTVADGRSARSSLEKEIKNKEKELMNKKDELDKMNKDWKSQAPLLSESARIKKQKDFQEKFMALRGEEMKFQQNIKKKEAMATQKIAMKVAGMVEKMALEKGLEAVFETNSAGLLYLKTPIDLTETVIAEYDKKTRTAKK